MCCSTNARPGEQARIYLPSVDPFSWRSYWYAAGFLYIPGKFIAGTSGAVKAVYSYFFTETL